jgi:hypothetical protein
MVTYHVYKTNCFQSSRVMLQSTWDKKSVFLHPRGPQEPHQAHANLSSCSLRAATLLRLLLRTKTSDGAFIFHAQSSLPYLLCSYVVLWIMGKRRMKLVYDIHDLNELPAASGIYARTRYHILRMLERVACRAGSIRKITVSVGLAARIADDYRCKKPIVVRSAPRPALTTSSPGDGVSSSNALVFFGTPERVPVALFDQIQASGLEIHLWGRGITPNTVSRGRQGPVPPCVKFLGAYSPSNLHFLRNYKILILYAPNIHTLNFRFSLPNKIFQALAAGMSLVVSENFEEIIQLLAPVPGSVCVLGDPAALQSVLNKALVARGPEYESRIAEFLVQLHADARERYLSALA